jgi:hypothetical protein
MEDSKTDHIQQPQAPEPEKDLFETIVEIGMKSQKDILEAILDAGYPLEYRDKEGNWVRENPDRTITIVFPAGQD